jgi:LPXTG-site transpeptidase (sortase) family protein
VHGQDPVDLVELTHPLPRRSMQSVAGRLVLGIGVVVAFAFVLLTVDRSPVVSEMGRAVGQSAGTIPAPSVAVTPVTLPPLPIPEALPENPYEDAPQVVVGAIEIPKIGISADLQSGMSLTAINRGPGWWPGTAMPGELGNVVVAGHRTTYSRPFYRLDELAPGDHVVFTTDGGRFVYEVRAVIVVPEHWIDIAAQSYAHTATLFACHPPGSARERIVAKLRLLDAAGLPVDADAALPPIDAEAQRTDHTLTVRDRTDVGAASGADPLSGSEG